MTTKYDEKVQKATEKVEKCKRAIPKHQKKLDAELAKNPESYSVKFARDNVKTAERKLEDAERILNNWIDKREKELATQRFIQDQVPQVIKDFLDKWEKLAYEWHILKYDESVAFKNKMKEEADEIRRNCVLTMPEYSGYLNEDGSIHEFYVDNLLNLRPTQPISDKLKEKELTYSHQTSRLADFAGSTVLKMIEIRNTEERENWLRKRLEEDKKAKTLDLMLRVSNIAGEITDADYLRISAKGNLDGYIIGKKGKAKVETVGAGGFNIQCFHYRTLIHPMD